MFGFLKKKDKKPEPTPEDKPTPLEVGAKIFQLNVNGMPRPQEKIIIELVGEGKLLEDDGHYEEALKCYEEAEELTFVICGELIEWFKARNPQRPDDWDWLYLKMIRRRIRVCRKALAKLEEEKGA